MYNKNFINECVESRKKLVKLKEFKRFQRGYIFKKFIFNIIGFVAVFCLSIVLFINTQKYDNFWIVVVIFMFPLISIPILNLLDAFLILISIRKAPTEEWLEHIGEEEKRAWYQFEIYNTNLFFLGDLSKVEYQNLRLVIDDEFKSFIYSPSGVLLTDEIIKNVEVIDKSYNDINSTVGNRIESKRIKKVYTKVNFSDGKFLTIFNASDSLIKKFEQVVQ